MDKPDTRFKKGEHTSPKTEFKKGLIPWNKGCSGEKYGKGNKRSEETRLKMSKPKKPFTEEHKRNLSNAKKGTVISLEHRKKLSKAIKGEKHYNWKGGIHPINLTIRRGIEFRLWRESVFARDNWTCQKCGVIGGRLNSHHIKKFSKYPELRFAIDNGITLCKKCHIDIHRVAQQGAQGGLPQ